MPPGAPRSAVQRHLGTLRCLPSADRPRGLYGLLIDPPRGYLQGMFQAIIMAASILALGETGRETLSGSLEGRELSLRVAGSGVTCRGDLVELSPGMGQGVLSCTDRREGTFHWRIERGEGTGYGRLGSEDLVITFG